MKRVTGEQAREKICPFLHGRPESDFLYPKCLASDCALWTEDAAPGGVSAPTSREILGCCGLIRLTSSPPQGEGIPAGSVLSDAP